MLTDPSSCRAGPSSQGARHPRTRRLARPRPAARGGSFLLGPVPAGAAARAAPPGPATARRRGGAPGQLRQRRAGGAAGRTAPAWCRLRPLACDSSRRAWACTNNGATPPASSPSFQESPDPSNTLTSMSTCRQNQCAGGTRSRRDAGDRGNGLCDPGKRQRERGGASRLPKNQRRRPPPQARRRKHQGPREEASSSRDSRSTRLKRMR